MTVDLDGGAAPPTQPGAATPGGRRGGALLVAAVVLLVALVAVLTWRADRGREEAALRRQGYGVLATSGGTTIWVAGTSADAVSATTTGEHGALCDAQDVRAAHGKIVCRPTDGSGDGPALALAALPSFARDAYIADDEHSVPLTLLDPPADVGPPDVRWGYALLPAPLPAGGGGEWLVVGKPEEPQVLGSFAGGRAVP